MAMGIVTPTVATAGNIILGEGKAYINYGLPDQLLIGATDGGIKISIDKKIKPVKFDGAYADHYLDTNGVPLVRVDTMEATITLQQLYLNYIHSKVISDCESTDTWESQDWAATGGTYAAETTIVNSGVQSAKMTASTTMHGIHAVFASAKNLAVFDNSEVSGTGDYIGFAIYIASQDKTDLSTASLRLALHDDTEGTETNYHYYDIAASALTAGYWNTFKIAKSAFTAQGAPAWTAKTGISLKLNGSPSAEVVCYIDSVSLIHNQTNAFQFPVQGGSFQYTDHTTYRKFIPDLEITEADYFDNVTFIGQKFDGKMFKIILKNCLNDGNLSLALQEKKEVVNNIQFTSHYDRTKGTTFPLFIREYV